jgi:heptosyltransferase-2
VDPAPEGLATVHLRLPNWLGDVVMAAPAVAALHRARPGARLVASAPSAFLPFARALPGVAEARAAEGVRREARTLRAERPDAVVVFPRSFRAALPARLARVPVRVGHGQGATRWLLTHAAHDAAPLRRAHRTRWFALLAEAFGPVAPDVPAPTLGPPPEARRAAERLLLALGRDPGRPLVVLEPGAAYGAAKCWPAERFGALARALRERGHDVVTIGTDASRPLEAKVAAAAGPGLLRAAGRTADLGVLMGVLSLARLVVSNDTGPMHLAAALGTPVLALFGASDPVVSGPLGPGPRRVLYEPEPCSPCFLRECPVPGHPCLEKWGSERVLREALAVCREIEPGALPPGTNA